MLPFHPVFHHTAEIAWPQNLYYGAEGKDIDEKLRFICGIIVNGAQPVFAFFMVFRMLFRSWQSEAYSVQESSVLRLFLRERALLLCGPGESGGRRESVYRCPKGGQGKRGSHGSVPG